MLKEATYEVKMRFIGYLTIFEVVPEIVSRQIVPISLNSGSSSAVNHESQEIYVIQLDDHLAIVTSIHWFFVIPLVTIELKLSFLFQMHLE